MQIGEVIRLYRKQLGMTQEEMAGRLGVTTPAVNKWENGNSNPDIELLAPIARLLHISLDTLMSFKEDLTEIEIGEIIRTLDEKRNTEQYDTAFHWAEGKIREYPGCNQLIWQMAIVLDSWRLLKNVPEGEKYDSKIHSWYETVLKDENEQLRRQAADSLFEFHFRKGQYDKAEEYLSFFPGKDPQAEMKKGRLYQAKGDREGAYKVYEQLLFSSYQFLNGVFSMLFALALEEDDTKGAGIYLEKQGQAARLFEMGRYREICGKLELVCRERNADETMNIVEQILESIGSLGDFQKSILYRHLDFKEIKESFYTDLKEELIKGFREDTNFDYMAGNENWEKLVCED